MSNYSVKIMSNYIDREVLLENLENSVVISCKTEKVPLVNKIFDKIISVIKQTPKVNVIETKQGTFINAPFNIGETVYEIATAVRLTDKPSRFIRKTRIESIEYGLLENGNLGVLTISTECADYDWEQSVHRSRLFKNREEAEKRLQEMKYKQ